ncbi:hypothetical protein WV31_10055 [Magnetospirillum sp. ME-1]|uniref:hypothetical protein n=1 Tax=Magnetospirillum sp. ME-1 TaxID=1639348 RepID=UPI000A17A77F|nr:hypothetical protein [Magnetospirillum sp. ME-1]ARJ65970.1 hypothetical protein WV31_10055 [Magnetospirillum sp. ME-1]
MPRMKTRKVVLNLTFDKPVTAEEAVAAAKDCIHGEFYPVPEKTGGAALFRIRSVTKHTEP